ncbi:MAG: hypothetical protein KF796_19535 [Ramlibacter sp.]|nr:hypothetical protein [Ramlibacter sp.]
MSYMKEPWFALLQAAGKTHKRAKLALMLGLSAPVISQVLNGSGKYGQGTASTDNVAEKVVHTFGRYPCPHLSEQTGFGDHAVEITADQCRAYAHRPAPAGSPGDMQHWQACQRCPHKAHTAPPIAREVKPRKSRNQENT